VSATSNILVPHAPPSAGIARRRCTDELRARGFSGRLVDDAALVMSELVGNAIRHGVPLSEGGIRVGWELRDDVLRLEVHDGGPGPRHWGASLPDGGSTDAESGRGLGIVAMLTHSWGTAFDGACAVVWAELPLRHSPRSEGVLEDQWDTRQEA
jgi:anti-sigma regulatory factor (Ser/Thr protein kinase)